MKRLLLPVLALLVGCFPQLPDPLVIQDLRVLSIQADPAVATITGFPPPVVTVRALVVDPDDPLGETIEHRWALELGDEDFEGRDQLEALVPDGPYTDELQLDFAASQERNEVEWLLAQLPLAYEASLGDFSREAVKLVPFLSPELPEVEPPGPTDPETATAALAEPSWSGPIEPPSLDPEDLPEGWNLNPELLELRLEDGTTWSLADGTLPGPAEPLYVGPVSAEEGLHFYIEVGDDGPTSRMAVELYRTTGRPGLPDPEEEEPDRDDRGNFGNLGTPVLDDELEPREFGWTPWSDGDERVARLFLVIRDKDGGQTWQEIRPEDPPEVED